MSQKNPSTWFITGCATGFGRELARVVLARGYRVVVTAPNLQQVEDLVAGHEDRALAPVIGGNPRDWPGLLFYPFVPARRAAVGEDAGGRSGSSCRAAWP